MEIPAPLRNVKAEYDKLKEQIDDLTTDATGLLGQDWRVNNLGEIVTLLLSQGTNLANHASDEIKRGCTIHTAHEQASTLIESFIETALSLRAVQYLDCFMRKQNNATIVPGKK